MCNGCLAANAVVERQAEPYQSNEDKKVAVDGTEHGKKEHGMDDEAGE